MPNLAEIPIEIWLAGAIARHNIRSAVSVHVANRDGVGGVDLIRDVQHAKYQSFNLHRVVVRLHLQRQLFPATNPTSWLEEETDHRWSR